MLQTVEAVRTWIHEQKEIVYRTSALKRDMTCYFDGMIKKILGAAVIFLTIGLYFISSAVLSRINDELLTRVQHNASFMSSANLYLELSELGIPVSESLKMAVQAPQIRSMNPDKQITKSLISEQRMEEIEDEFDKDPIRLNAMIVTAEIVELRKKQKFWETVQNTLFTLLILVETIIILFPEEYSKLTVRRLFRKMGFK